MGTGHRAIALFGGAFDPPHLGHVLCACYALQIAAIDEVWVLPSMRHPYDKRMAPFEERLHLCRLAFAGLEAVRVREDERDNPDGRTWDLIDHLRQRETAVDWMLIGGTDTRQDLPHWYHGTDLQATVQVIAVPRRGYDDDHPAALPAISSTVVRQRLAAGAAIDDLVPRTVAEHIAARGLYSAGASATNP